MIAAGIGARDWHYSALCLLAPLLAGQVAATEQIPDRIQIENGSYPLCKELLAPLLARPEVWSRFLAHAKAHMGSYTANWRGYQATWVLRDGQLFLDHMVFGA